MELASGLQLEVRRINRRKGGTCETKVYRETTEAIVHFFVSDQVYGLWGHVAQASSSSASCSDSLVDTPPWAFSVSSRVSIDTVGPVYASWPVASDPSSSVGSEDEAALDGRFVVDIERRRRTGGFSGPCPLYI
jgi:hypothetical protein